LLRDCPRPALDSILRPRGRWSSALTTRLSRHLRIRGRLIIDVQLFSTEQKRCCSEKSNGVPWNRTVFFIILLFIFLSLLLMLYRYLLYAINCLDREVRNTHSRQQTSSFRRRIIESPRDPEGHKRQTLDWSADLLAWYGSDLVDLPDQPETKNHVVQRSPMVFLGVELVDWLQWQVPRLSRRSDAVNYASQLLVDGLIYRVHVEDGLMDSSRRSFHECCLYAFTPEPCDLHRANWRRCLRPNTLE